jgi:hypothetical protein
MTQFVDHSLDASLTLFEVAAVAQPPKENELTDRSRHSWRQLDSRINHQLS